MRRTVDVKIRSEICYCGASLHVCTYRTTTTKRNLGRVLFYLLLSGYRQTAFTINYKIYTLQKKRKVKTTTEESDRRNENIYTCMKINRNYYYSVVKTKHMF